MKLFGGKSKNKRPNTNVTNKNTTKSPNKKRNKWSNFSKKKKTAIIVTAILGVFLVCLIGLFSIIRWEIQPFYDMFFKPSIEDLSNPRRPRPVVNPEDKDAPPLNINEGDDHIGWDELQEIRNTDQYTFLIMGIDGHGNTDVIMVASFDAKEKTLNIVSIPRDTLINVSWNPKKINSIQPVMRNRYRDQDNAYNIAMDATIVQLRDFLGFELDFWVTVNMAAFVRLIDDIGGVEFDVPRDMHWSDPENDYEYDLTKGVQVLDGVQALGLLRYRATIGDIGRITTQQRFLEAFAKQLLSKRNSVSVTSMADIFFKHVRTDIQLNHLVWFGREFLKMDADDINFAIMPGTVDKIGIYDLITVHVDEWLEIVNEKLSYFHENITKNDVSILTRGTDGELFVTDDKWQDNLDWTSRRSAGQSTTTNTNTNPVATTDAATTDPPVISATDPNIMATDPDTTNEPDDDED